MSRTEYQLEELEPRVLLSADGLGAYVDVDVMEDGLRDAAGVDIEQLDSRDGIDDASSSLNEAPADVGTPGVAAAAADRSIVFVDAAVPEYETLVADLVTPRGKSDVNVVVIARDTDGVEQITQALLDYRDVREVHIVSHANKEAVRLGDSWLTRGSLEWYSGAITSWRDALSGEADILFYGCELASSADGRALAQAISELTGADVAASSDATGHALRGGDWELEAHVGDVEASIVFSAELQKEWDGVLVAPSITSHETVDDDGDGQIDHIRIITDQGLDDDFSGLSITVAGYALDASPYLTHLGAGGVGDTVFYVKLVQGITPDTDATPLVTVTANTTLSNLLEENISVDAGTAATDRASPMVIDRNTADLDGDGFIDAIHITFTEAIQDLTVEASDFTVSSPSVTGLTFSPTAGGDTANDADIYLTFNDGASHSGATPLLAYTESAVTDVEDAAGNRLGTFAAVSTTDKAAPVLLSSDTADLDADGWIDAVHLRFSEPIVDATLVANDWDVAGVTLESFTSTTNGDLADDGDVYITFDDGALDTAAQPTVDYTTDSPTDPDLQDAAGNPLSDIVAAPSDDMAAPVVVALETADSNGDGWIDAVHVTFNEPILDTTVIANDWDVLGVDGESFSSTTNGDTANDADIYITFTDGVLDTRRYARLDLHTRRSNRRGRRGHGR